MAEGGLDRYLGLAPLETEEGGSVAVRPANLNLTAVLQLITSYRGTLAAEPPRLRLVLARPPLHGRLTAGNQDAPPLTGDVDVDDVLDGRVVYRHDHSDTLADRLGLVLYLRRSAAAAAADVVDATDGAVVVDRPDILLFNGTLAVDVLPINDQVFELVTKAPAMQVRSPRPVLGVATPRNPRTTPHVVRERLALRRSEIWQITPRRPPWGHDPPVGRPPRPCVLGRQ